MFIIYECDDEVLVTTPENEPALLEVWFKEGGRNVEEYDRSISNEVAVQVNARLKPSY